MKVNANEHTTWTVTMTFDGDEIEQFEEGLDRFLSYYSGSAYEKSVVYDMFREIRRACPN